jgi:putative GTP pyrophosphokinase
MNQHAMDQLPMVTEIAYLSENSEILSEYQGFLAIHQIYQAAIKEMRTKLEILNDEFKVCYAHNPIRHLESRLKTPQSILKKLKRYNLPISAQSARDNLTDIAGVRVICHYIDDIYMLADALLRQEDITLIKKKDYIANPKKNGYRSLHLIVKIPVCLSDRVEQVPVEIQIRTVGMDFWACLEHQLSYKQERVLSEEVSIELYECAQTIAELDRRMQNLYKKAMEET